MSLCHSTTLHRSALDSAHNDAAIDSGCTSHTWPLTAPVDNFQPTPAAASIQVTLPNNHIMAQSHHGSVPIPDMPTSAKAVNIFPDHSYKPLLSLGQLADAGYTFHGDKLHLILTHSHHKDLIATRCPSSGMYLLSLTAPHSALPVPARPPCSARSTDSDSFLSNNAFSMTTKPDLAIFYHRAVFSPVPSTFIAAINKGFFSSWPGLTADLISKHLPKSLATAKGHSKLARIHIRSTRPALSPPALPPPSLDPAALPVPSARTKTIHLQVLEPKALLATDLTGRFPTISSRGYSYIIVCYIYDTNGIIVRPMKNRSTSEHIRVYNDIFCYLTKRGLRPAIHKMDNECPQALRDIIVDVNDNKLELVPPHDHRTNPAEKCIDTFKCHLISGLSAMDSNFPLHLWCRLLPQCQDTLNMLRTSRLHPHLSAFTHQNGQFDYNAHPIAPPGLRTLVYETPQQRKTWAQHGVDAWYLGYCPDHYRCYNTYVPATRGERIAHTVSFFPHDFAVPSNSHHDDVARSLRDLTSALRHRYLHTPVQPVGDDQFLAIQALEKLFCPDLAPPSIPFPVPPPAVLLPPVPVPAQPATLDPDPIQPTIELPSTLCSPPDSPLPALVSPTPLSQPDPLLDSSHHRYPTRFSLSQRSNSMACTSRYVYAAANLPHTPAPSPTFSEHLACPVIDPDSGASLEYRHLIQGPDKDIWIKALANDLGRLAQGVGTRMPTGNSTIFFIHPSEIPTHKKITYGRLVVDIRPLKDEKYRVRLTVGGDKLDFFGDASSVAASLATVKLLLNSVISTPGSTFSTADIKDFFYGSFLPDPEYMKMQLKMIPSEIITQYNLLEFVKDGWVYLKIVKGMPGLKQAARLANDRLVHHLAPYGYAPVDHTPSLWKHTSNGIFFALVVDDFGIKSPSSTATNHLLQALRDKYVLTVDPTGTKFLGFTLEWNYLQQKVYLSIPNYVKHALHRLQHSLPDRLHHSPHRHASPSYGKKIQYATQQDDSEAVFLPATAKTLIQRIIGIFLYYGIAIDLTMLVALGTLATQQSKPTQSLWDDITWFLNYAASHPDAKLCFSASDMILYVASDGSYLSESGARSRVGGIFYLSSNLPLHRQSPDPDHPFNAPFHVVAKILKMITSSAMETEVAATFYNAKEALPFRVALNELGHPQPPTPIEVDNETAIGFLKRTMKQKHSKAIDMRFYWVRDRVHQNQFLIYWRPGSHNVGDYVSKHHPPGHHCRMRPKFFVCLLVPTLSRTETCLHRLSFCLQRGCDIPRKRVH